MNTMINSNYYSSIIINNNNLNCWKNKSKYLSFIVDEMFYYCINCGIHKSEMISATVCKCKCYTGYNVCKSCFYKLRCKKCEKTLCCFKCCERKDTFSITDDKKKIFKILENYIYIKDLRHIILDFYSDNTMQYYIYPINFTNVVKLYNKIGLHKLRLEHVVYIRSSSKKTPIFNISLDQQEIKKICKLIRVRDIIVMRRSIPQRHFLWNYISPTTIYRKVIEDYINNERYLFRIYFCSRIF